MKHRSSRSAWISLVLIAASALACDDDPADADSGCDDANTSCVFVTVTAAEMTYRSIAPAPETIVHWLEWTLDSEVDFDYGPGQHLTVYVTFDPPLKVRYDHPEQYFTLTTALDGFTDDRSVGADADLVSRDWTHSFSGAYCQGLRDADQQALTMNARFEPLGVEKELRILVFEFTVPETYTMGDRYGESVRPEVLTMRRVIMSTVLYGEDRLDPPVWQGEYDGAQVLSRRGRLQTPPEPSACAPGGRVIDSPN